MVTVSFAFMGWILSSLDESCNLAGRTCPTPAQRQAKYTSPLASNDEASV